MNQNRRTLVFGGIVAVFAASAAVTLAVEPVIRGAGDRITRVKTAASEERFTVTSTEGVVDLPGARHRLILGESALVVARFSAATFCVGDSAGPCGVQITVLDNAAGFAEVGQLLPTSSPIDSAVRPENNDNEESHTIERSLVLPAGDYTFQATVQVTNFGTGVSTFQISGWHFVVERIVN